ncbi:MAG: protein translocase subunit SecF [Desulfobacterales bacterium]|nr:protein translocase subunit SecF [Desulfobacterales bacterium]
MQFIKDNVNINFIGNKKIAIAVSAILLLVSVISLVAHKGPRYGIDFAGGTLIQVKFANTVNLDDVKSGLADIDLGKSSVQLFGDPADNEYLVHTDITDESTQGFSESIQNALTTATGIEAEIRRVEMVGAKVGEDLQEKALFAIFYALLFISIYISGRFELKWVLSGVIAVALMVSVSLLSIFNVSISFLIGAAIIVTLLLFWFLELKYAMGATVALLHDIFITIGIFSLFDKEFTLPIIAALLTIIGYSLNDTIITFDRIRENLRRFNKDSLDIVINRSINETLSRTILTSLTTLIVLIALFLLGGSIIHDFAFAMIVGVVIGTYSSVFIASPILLAWHGKTSKK